MGYHIILHLTATIKPEYIDFLNRDFFFDDHPTYYVNDSDDEDDVIRYKEGFPPHYRELADRWIELGIGHGFYEFTVNDDCFEMTLSKKPYRHMGNLESAYRRFIKEIIVPISTHVSRCIIEHDDYDIPSTYYTDSQIRSHYF